MKVYLVFVNWAGEDNVLDSGFSSEAKAKKRIATIMKNNPSIVSKEKIFIEEIILDTV